MQGMVRPGGYLIDDLVLMRDLIFLIFLSGLPMVPTIEEIDEEVGLPRMTLGLPKLKEMKRCSFIFTRFIFSMDYFAAQ